MGIHGLGGSHVPPEGIGGVHSHNNSDSMPPPPSTPTYDNMHTWLQGVGTWFAETYPSGQSSTDGTFMSQWIGNFSVEMSNSKLPTGVSFQQVISATQNLFKSYNGTSSTYGSQISAMTACFVSDYNNLSGMLTNQLEPGYKQAVDTYNSYKKKLTAIQAKVAKNKSNANYSNMLTDISNIENYMSAISNKLDKIKANIASYTKIIDQGSAAQAEFSESNFTLFLAGSTDASQFTKQLNDVDPEKNGTSTAAQDDENYFSSEMTMLTGDIDTKITQINNWINPTPSGGLPTPPKPPYTGAAVRSYGQALYQWIGGMMNSPSPPLSPDELQFLHKNVGDLGQNALNATSTQLTNDMNFFTGMVVPIAHVPTGGIAKLMKPVIDAAIALDSKYESTVNKLNTVVGLQEQDINKLNQATALLKKILSKGKLDADDKAQINSLNSSISKLQSQLKTLNGDISKIKQEITKYGKMPEQMWSYIFQAAAKSHRGANAEITAINKLSSEIVDPSDDPSYSNAYKELFHKFGVNVPKILSSVVSFRESLQKGNKYPPPPKLQPGEMYMDMQYFNNVVRAGDVQAAFEAYFQSLEAANINRIILSFAQFSDIGKASPDTASDTVFQDIAAHPTAWKTFLSVAKENHMQIQMSFGGEDANSTTWALPSDAGGPAKAAQWLYDNVFTDKQGDLVVQNIDYDIEDNGFPASGADLQNCLSFMQAIHGLLAKHDPPGRCVLTGEGHLAPPESGASPALFWGKIDPGPPPVYSDNIFNTMFDDANLMLYGQNYYLAPHWITSWIGSMGGDTKNPSDPINAKILSEIHIGFQDSINYNDPGADGSGSQQIFTQSNGQAAAIRYEELLAELKSKGYDVSSIGGPFVWPNFESKTPLPSSQFETDFYKELNMWNELNN